ncbi:plasmid mobilization relaxosome protein MobC [Larkinella bovis]|uniref:Plasmid mobilization relaxosome protein MobC n=1 Tax=Larkinella bovis TaxID=683041 RepID=A0ABW0IB51_9BACT
MEWERNKGGRPKKEEKEKRTMNVRIRFTEDEYQRLKTRMATTNAPDFSTFVRAICLEKPLQLAVPTSSQDDQMLDLIREIRVDITKIGSNINQSVKRINSTTDYQNLQKETQEMSSRMQEIEVRLRSLMSAFTNKA